MRQLAAMHVRSVLLTSGTLSPLDSFAHELQLPFRISLENPHVVDPSQVCHSVLYTAEGFANGRCRSESYRSKASVLLMLASSCLIFLTVPQMLKNMPK